MEFLKIDKDSMIKMLINNNKLNSVREAVLTGDYDDVIAKERLNFCTEEELIEIARDEKVLLEVIKNYSLNEKIIDLIIQKFPEHTNALKKIIVDYTNLLKPEHFDVLLKNLKLKSLIVENQSRLSDESTLYLGNKNVINMAIHIVVEHEMKNKNIKDIDMDSICVVAYNRKFDEEETNYVLDKIFEYNSDLHMKGYIDIMMVTQDIPSDVLYKIVTSWEYTIDEPWFENMLKHQNLDSVIEYIIENKALTRKAVGFIVENTKTSTRKLGMLYTNYSDLIVKANPYKLPVLDCHSHMC